MVQANQCFTVTENKPVHSLGTRKGRLNPVARYKLKLDKVYFYAQSESEKGHEEGGEVNHTTSKLSNIYTVS